MAKKEIAEDLKQLRQAISDDKAIIGTARTVKGLQSGKLSAVYLASNCPKDVEKSITHYANLCGAKVVDLQLDNEELGVFCKKNFFVAVIGVA